MALLVAGPAWLLVELVLVASSKDPPTGAVTAVTGGVGVAAWPGAFVCVGG